MAWSLWSCDTVTGTKLQKLPVPASFSWERSLNSGAGGSMVVPIRDTNFGKLDMKTLTKPLATTLVLDWDGVVVYAGVVDNRIYNHAAGTVTFPHSDIWTILSRRLAVDHTVESKFVNQVFTSRSSGTVAKKMVELVLLGLPDANMLLPITFSADAAGTISRTYYGYHFPWLGDVLRDLMNESGGTDIDFRPQWVAGKLSWQMRTGSLTAGSFEWNVGAGKSGVLGLTVTEDSAKLAQNSVATGEGSEIDKLAQNQRVLSPVYPFTERLAALPDATNLAALGRYASGDLAAFKQPTEQWGFSILTSGTPSVSDLLLGGSAKTWVQDDPWLSDGWHDNRIIGFSGDLSETVKLQFQPGGV